MTAAHPTGPALGMRERKKQRTRAAIQSAALDLIKRHGYDATTCEQIAAAADVSPATFFRYFPTKEDVLLQDDYDPLIAGVVAARPATEGPFEAVRQALVTALAQMPEEEVAAVLDRTRLLLSVPALRARLHEQNETARAALAEALAPRLGRQATDLRVQAVAAACGAAVSAAVEEWARTSGNLADHVDVALRAVSSR